MFVVNVPQDPCEAHPDTYFISNPVGGAVGLLVIGSRCRGPGGYHGDGVMDPANTDARAGQSEQDPSEAHLRGAAQIIDK